MDHLPREAPLAILRHNRFFEPTYIPDPGVTDTLTVPYTVLVDLGDGSYGSADDLNTPYNPADPTFGGNG